jgi:ubiquinone/menaquinone biosynthesis C-methylase UbiE
MAQEPFPLSYPTEARLAFGNDEALRRIAKVARFNSGCRVLHLGCGTGSASILFAREFGCSITAVDSDEQALERLRERVRANNLNDRVQIRSVDPKKLPFPEAEFEGVFSDGRFLMSLETAAKKLRRFIAPKGRLCLVYPVKVGRQPNPGLLEFWEKRLQEPLRYPREALQAVEVAGRRRSRPYLTRSWRTSTAPSRISWPRCPIRPTPSSSGTRPRSTVLRPGAPRSPLGS